MMTFMDSKDQHVVAKVFGCPMNAIAENVIVTFEDRLNHFAQFLDTPVHFGLWWKGITGTYQNTPVSIIVCGMGASQAGDCVMFLGHTECSQLLFSGCAGALAPTLRRGDLIVVKEALIGEGFSPYFSHAERVLSHPELVNKIVAYAYSNHIALHESLIFTTGSLYAETRSFLTSVRERGADCVDMETSAVLTAAAYKGIPASALHYISDLPLAGSSQIQHSLKKRYNQMPNLLLDIMKHLL